MGVPPNGSPTLLHLSAAKANSPAASYFTKFIMVALEASHRGEEGLLDERLEICRRILSQASATVKLVDGILIEKTDGKTSSADAPPHWLADCEEDWWQEFCEGLCRLLGRVEEHAEQELQPGDIRIISGSVLAGKKANGPVFGPQGRYIYFAGRKSRFQS